MNSNVPIPPADEDLEALRAKLKAQRAEQKEKLAKHKQTTFLACETAKKEGTTYYDPAKLRKRLEDDEVEVEVEVKVRVKDRDDDLDEEDRKSKPAQE